MEDKLILVTGASGHFQAYVVQQLLRAGCRVRGTIRSHNDQKEVSQLMKLMPDSKHKLELVEVIVTSDEGWDEAVSGCWAVIHTILFVRGMYEYPTEEEYMAIEYHGKLRVLRAASKAGVKKFVCTSDFGAVLGLSQDLVENKVYTEDDWTDTNLPKMDPDSKAKTLGEKAVWDFVNELPEVKKMDLTVILLTCPVGPPLIIGSKHGGSFEHLNLILNRTVPGSPNLQLLSCDVRDVAAAHVKSLITPEAVGKRIIAFCGESLWMNEINKIISKEFTPQGYSIFTNTLPNFLARMPTFFDKRIESVFNAQKLGKALSTSNKRMVEILGIKPRSISDAFIEQAYAMIDAEMVYKAKNYKGWISNRAECES